MTEQIIIEPVCFACKYLIDRQDDGRWLCDAFPSDGIPPIIWVKGNTHKGPIEGDHGVRFLPLSEGRKKEKASGSFFEEITDLLEEV